MYIARRTAAGALIVIDVDTSSSGIPSKTVSKSSKGVDSDARTPHLALGHRRVGVVPHLGREVERHREPGGALIDEVVEALVRLRGGTHPRVLAHRPEASAVHGRVDAARVRLLTRVPQILTVVVVRDISRGVQRVDLLPPCRW